MSKLKSPLLGLGARGTVGDALTYQERQRYSFVREKPIPAYRRTLPQQYQRWLYQDYAYYWTQQSLATQRQYHALGSRHHMTGFAYWMSYYLKNMPDICAMWFQDEHTGAIAHDSSRNSNHATIFGSQHVTGLIDYALSHDGVNDFAQAPANSTLRPTLASWEIFFRPRRLNIGDEQAIYISRVISDGWSLFIQTISSILRFNLRLTTGWADIILTNNLQLNTWYHVLVTYDAINLLGYLNGYLVIQTPAPDPILYNINAPVDIGNWVIHNYDFMGDTDHTILYSRPLDSNDALRHSLRRYPA